MIDDLIEKYRPGPETVRLVRETPTVLLVGITGAGKDTIKKQLLKSGGYHHIVSHTTRQPRANGGVLEQDGVEYHFITEKTAEKMLQSGEFIEAKLVHGTVYGTSSAEILAANQEHKIAITDVDVQGVAEYKAISDKVIALFILPPDYEEWQRRLNARYGKDAADPADIAKRTHSAIAELEEALAKPYYHFIVNADLYAAAATADKIAHGNDSFNRIDDEVRAHAEELLHAIRKASGQAETLL